MLDLGIQIMMGVEDVSPVIHFVHDEDWHEGIGIVEGSLTYV